MNEQSQRLVSVQILRGVAAVLVTVAHVNFLLWRGEKEFGYSHIANFAHWRGIGAIGVDIFFVISGFVMAFTMAKYRGRPLAFLTQRYWRIAPLCYLATFVWVCVQLPSGHIPSPGSVANAVTFLPVTREYAIPPLEIAWTLAFEFVLYIFVVIALLIGRGPLFLLGALVCCGSVGFFYVSDIALLRWFTNPIILEFAMGVSAFLAWRHLPPPSAALSLAIGIACGLFLAEQILWGRDFNESLRVVIAVKDPAARLVEWGIPAALIFFALLQWRPGNGALSMAARKLGDASYSLYLTHFIALHAVLAQPWLPADLMWPVALAVALAVGLAVYHVIERPMMGLLQSKKQNQRYCRAT